MTENNKKLKLNHFHNLSNYENDKEGGEKNLEMVKEHKNKQVYEDMLNNIDNLNINHILNDDSYIKKNSKRINKYNEFFKRNKERIKIKEEEKVNYMLEQTNKLKEELNISLNDANQIVINHNLINKDKREPITKKNIKWLPPPNKWILNFNDTEHYETEDIASKNALEKDNYHIVERMSRYADSASETMIYKVCDGKSYIVWISPNCNFNYKYESIIKKNINEEIKSSIFKSNSDEDDY